MNTQSEVVPAGWNWTRPFYWSVRRELWENRSICVAPLVVAGIVLFGFSISLASLPRRFVALSTLTLERQAAAHALPYHITATAIVVTTLVVGLFYCLGALQGERRDRSILFWKSLPVSDLTTVLAKASIPMVVLPLVAFLVVSLTQMIMFRLSIGVLLLHGLDAAPLREAVRPLPMAWVLLYGLATFALWGAPVYGWLLVVSAWARRVALLWALGPPLALCLVEKIAFNTSGLAVLLTRRLTGSFAAAFDLDDAGTMPAGGLPHVDPTKFLSSAGLWAGLFVAAAFLIGAVWLRRRGEPI